MNAVKGETLSLIGDSPGFESKWLRQLIIDIPGNIHEHVL